MRERPRAYERYRHFKGRDYQVLALAKDAEDGKELVVYQGLYEPYEIWVRGLEEFLSEVDRETYPEAKQRYRFERIEDKTGRESAPPEPLREQPRGRSNAEIDPVLLRFLDAETNEEKLEVLTASRELLTPALLTPMELSLGMEPQDGVDQDIRYKQIRNTLQYKQKYERARRN